MRKTQQRPFFLRKAKTVPHTQPLLIYFYTLFSHCTTCRDHLLPFIINKMLRSDRINMMELIDYIMSLHLSLSDPSSRLPSPLCSLWQSKPCLTTRNMLLMKQIEQRLRQWQSCQCNRVRYPFWAACGNGPPQRSNGQGQAKEGKDAKREERRGRRQCVCHNKLLSMTKQHWLPSNTAPDMCFSMCVYMHVLDCTSICTPKCSRGDIKAQPLFLIMLHFGLVITKSLMQDVNAESCARI